LPTFRRVSAEEEAQDQDVAPTRHLTKPKPKKGKGGVRKSAKTAGCAVGAQARQLLAGFTAVSRCRTG
jgi:hypothetical protein